MVRRAILESTLRNNKITYLVIILSMLLNHSARILGVNVSFADVILLLLLFLLIFEDKFVIPVYPTIFFLTLSFILPVVSFIYTPLKFSVLIGLNSYLKEYTKLLVVFLYFLLGYNVSKLNMIDLSIKFYSVGAYFIGLAGLALSLFNLNFLNDVLYFGKIRFRGFMADPNYYTAIQNSAMIYFLRNKNIKLRTKILMYIFNLVLIIMSGSKTGIITVIGYSIYLLLEHQLFFIKRNRITVLKNIFKLIFLMFLIIKGPAIINIFIDAIANAFPIFERVQALFIDFSEGVSGGGSGRNTTWESAIGLIKESPIFGVGLGTYIPISQSLFSTAALAHNTYLQIFAEWGGLLATVFFSYISILLMKITLGVKKYKYDSVILKLRDILIIMLIGSISLSLNNARMFWLYLGALQYYVKITDNLTFDFFEYDKGHKQY